MYINSNIFVYIACGLGYSDPVIVIVSCLISTGVPPPNYFANRVVCEKVIRKKYLKTVFY